MELLLERCMSTSVSVMKPGNTMRCFREDSFSTSTSRYVRTNNNIICVAKD